MNLDVLIKWTNIGRVWQDEKGNTEEYLFVNAHTTEPNWKKLRAVGFPTNSVLEINGVTGAYALKNP